MTRIKQLGFLLVFLLLAGGIFFNRVLIKEFILDWQRAELPKAVEYQNSYELRGTSYETEVKEKPISRNSKLEIPNSYNLAVPFQPQAPRGDWNMPYQEACEEASLIMADAFYNKKSLTVSEMDERIKELVAWQVKKFGYYKDTTAEEVAVIAREYFGLKAELDYSISVESIKKYISQNKLVLVPAAGKVLPNPNFKNGGPLYHMLVIRGYTADKFITNDPGTRQGKEFVYKYDDLINAVHDWPSSAISRRQGYGRQEATDGKPSEADMLTGAQVMLVIDK